MYTIYTIDEHLDVHQEPPHIDWAWKDITCAIPPAIMKDLLWTVPVLLSQFLIMSSNYQYMPIPTFTSFIAGQIDNIDSKFYIPNNV